MRIRWKLILSISIPLMAVDGAVVYRDYTRLRDAAEARARQQVEQRAEMAAALIESKLTGVMGVAESTADVLASQPGRRARPMRGLLGANLRERWVTAVALAFEPNVELDPDQPRALLLTRSRRGPQLSLPDDDDANQVRESDWYAIARASRAPQWTSSFQMPRFGKGLLYGYVAPIRSGEAFDGAVMVIVRAEDLERLVGRSESPPPNPSVNAAPPPVASNTSTAIPPPAEPQTPTTTDTPAQPGPTGPVPEAVGLPVAPLTEEPTEPDNAPRIAFPLGRLPDTDAGETARVIAQLGFGAYSIIDREGKFIFSPDPALMRGVSVISLAQGAGLDEVVDALQTALRGGSGVVRSEKLGATAPGLRPGEVYWVAFAAVPSTGWAFMTVMPESSVMDPVMDWLSLRVGYSLMALALPVLIVTLVAIRLSRPIEELAGAVDQLAAGEMDVHVKGVRGRDEVAKLARGFNAMVDRLREHMQTIRRETAAREKVDSELRIARKIQTDLLPRTFPPFPDHHEFDLHAINEPARHMAGDFFDFFFTPAGLLTVVIADVSGKGVPAAMLMAVTRTIVRNQAMAGHSPLDLIKQTNDLLVADTADGLFVTLFLAQYDPADGRITYVNAGHTHPRVIAADGSVRTFGRTTAPLLGVEPVSVIGGFEQEEQTLHVGESLLMFTDGVTEARGPDGRMLGDAGLDRWLAEIGPVGVEPLCRELVRRVTKLESATLSDDVTVVALRRNAV